MKKMVKSAAALMVLALLGLSVVGCASQPAAAAAPAATTNPNLPPWIGEQAPDDVLWGIGMAKRQRADMSITFATNAARVSIAQQLNSSVENMITEYYQEAGGLSNPAAVALSQNVSRTLSQAKLVGSKPIGGPWEAPDGTYWVRVEYSVAEAAKVTKEAVAVATEESQYAEFKAAQGLEQMDYQIQQSKAKDASSVPRISGD